MSRDKAFKGQDLTYEIKITNQGTASADETYIFDIIPFGTTLIKESINHKNKLMKTKIFEIDGKQCLFWHIKQSIKPDAEGETLRFKVKIE